MKEIQLTKGFVTLVSDKDYDWLNQWEWHVTGRVGQRYAMRTRPMFKGARFKLSMHREIINAPGGVWVDHRDRNSLNNQRYNLRLCTYSQSMANRWCVNKTGFKGVQYEKNRRSWNSYLTFGRQTIWLGAFDDPEDAACEYDYAARIAYGKFALTNKMMGLL